MATGLRRVVPALINTLEKRRRSKHFKTAAFLASRVSFFKKSTKSQNSDVL